MSMLCRVFGHRPYQGNLTFSFYAKVNPQGKFQPYKDTGPAVFCRRCGKSLGTTTKLTIGSDGFISNVVVKEEKP